MYDLQINKSLSGNSLRSIQVLHVGLHSLMSQPLDEASLNMIMIIIFDEIGETVSNGLVYIYM